jgi:dipeptidyl aminopeptidase/acylaminoacyl peptidase
MLTTAPYGSWLSPVSVDQLTSSSVGLAAPQIDGEHLYWLESRADLGGRVGIRRRRLTSGEPEDVTPSSANVRNRVHEYGGGEYAVGNGVVVYSNFSDGRLYVTRPTSSSPSAGSDDVPITPALEVRYGDVRVHPDRNLVLAVREDHRGEGEPENTIVALALEGPNDDGGTVLCSGADFYSTPELSSDGQLAWTQWDHPNMPWDSTVIMVGTFDGGGIVEQRVVAGGTGESVVQPRWLAPGQLIFVSDRTDWWNLYLWADGHVQTLCPVNAEFCPPQWVLGQSPYAVLDEDHLICTVVRDGGSELNRLQLSTGELSVITEPGTDAYTIAVSTGHIATVLSFRDRPSALSILDLGSGAWSAVRPSSEMIMDAASVAVAEAVSWSSDQGEVHGWFYPPRNGDFTAPTGTRPPLITLSHGGPTASAQPGFTLAYQFWTSRGYAILDVNYGGSTGYGRAYRERLRDRWGIVDVADCAAGAQAVGERGLADPNRLAIKGGSAGGYTTLRALTSTTVFGAGISQYGVGDLEALATDTHKFESRYLDGLVGAYPADRATYVERSPLHHVDRLATPILLLQGLDDKVVPPNQAETFAAAARAKGLPVALIMFAGEGHGFRRAETIKASLNAQIFFLSRIFGFTPADDVPPITIDNLG